MKTIHQFKNATLWAVFFMASISNASAGIWYVRADAAGDGTSWANAGSLQSTVDAAAGGDEIWVAAGVYTVSSGAVLTMKAGVALYGGFIGGESQRSQRDWSVNLTTIDGENVRVGVYGADNAILDGFTITRCFVGMYNLAVSPAILNCIFTDNSYMNKGGGIENINASPDIIGCFFTNNTRLKGAAINNMNSSPLVENCHFITNETFTGGVIHNDQSSPPINDCIFIGNTGGAINNENQSAPVVNNCTFTGNSGGGIVNYQDCPTTISNSFFLGNTNAGNGGAIHNENVSLSVINCVFVQNNALSGGGIAHIGAFSPTLINCTFVNNTASRSGGGIYIASHSTTEIKNCIIWDNQSPVGPEIYHELIHLDLVHATNCCIRGGYSGEANLDEDPLFLNPPYSVQLLPDSPCIGTGDNTVAPPTDILGRARSTGAGVTIGAYEGAVAPEDIVTLNMLVNLPGDGITTPSAGIHHFGRGDRVFLSTRNYGLLFSHWEMDLSGGLPIASLLMDDDKTVSAVFNENIYRVDAASHAIDPDGRSWLSAFQDIQSAVDTAIRAGGGEIWVAAGTYSPTANPIVSMKEGVFIFGGFQGLETKRHQRDWEANTTTLDGEQTRRCVSGADNALLDGFYIINGVAKNGGGMYNSAKSPQVINCTFKGNTGGGMYNINASPWVMGCVFENNYANMNGGGMYN